MDLTYAYALDITKSERDENGDLIVYGKATGPDLDLDGDRCDPAWLKQAMPRWMEWGNLREMHQPVLAGIGLELTNDGDDWYVKSKVIDDKVAKKIEEGGYKGQSIGIKSGIREKREGQNWIIGGEVIEVSYVDRPCNPTAKLAIAKMAGGEWEPQEAEETAAEPDPITKGIAYIKGAYGDEDWDKILRGVKSVNDIRREAGLPELKKPDTAAVKVAALDGRDEMKALAYITKAARGAATSEQPDIDDANEAIAVLARLIISEANDLADGDLSEIGDIQTLMEAVCALKWFIRSEEREGSDDEMAYAYLAALPDITKRTFSAEQRRQAAASGAAMPGGRYPIENSEDLHNAIHAVGRGKGSHEAIRQHIIRRAKALGLTSELPEGWTMSSKNKTSEVDEAKSVETDETQTTEVSTETSETVTKTEIADLVKAAVAEAMSPLEERNKALEAELAEVKKAPVPGGPVLLAPTGVAKDDSTSRAKRMREYAKTLSADIAPDYYALADKLEKGETAA